MNQTEPSFDELKRLLKLKQHEVPPPGYFNDFSDQVVSRIRAGEAGGKQTYVERLEVEAPWLIGFFRIFEARSGLIGGLATGLCLLLVLAVVFDEHSEVASKNSMAVSAPVIPAPDNSVAALAPSTLVAADDNSTGIVAATNPVTSLQPVATLFGQPASGSLFQPVGFTAVGH